MDGVILYGETGPTLRNPSIHMAQEVTTMPDHNPPQGEALRQPSRPVAGERALTPDAYLDQIDPAVQASLTPDQWGEVRRVMALALPQPSPKLIDLRFDIDLLLSRYYIVLMVGKDRRRSTRPYAVSGVTRWANWVAAVVLLLGLNLAISAGVLLLAYLLKSALGINLFPGHLRGFGD